MDVQYSAMLEIVEMMANPSLAGNATALKLSDAVIRRFEELTKKSKNEGLTESETEEIRFIGLAYQMVSMARIRSRKYAAAQAA